MYSNPIRSDAAYELVAIVREYWRLDRLPNEKAQYSTAIPSAKTPADKTTVLTTTLTALRLPRKSGILLLENKRNLLSMLFVFLRGI